MFNEAKTLTRRLACFSWRVLKRFNENHGILLASAVGYNTALSVVPLFALVLIVLSHFLEDEVLVEIVTTQVRLLVPGEPAGTRATLQSFLDQREMAGWIVLGAVLLFSSLAFRIIESAMRMIFQRQERTEKRYFLVSALMPFAFTGAIGLGLIAVTVATAGLDAASESANLPAPATLLSICGFLGLVALFSAFYRLLPVGKISTRRSLVGGLVAATLWEGVRRLLQWYFASISLVGVVYGSLATVVVILLSMEIAAIILLLGAQVIAELEASADADLPWHVEPEVKSEGVAVVGVQLAAPSDSKPRPSGSASPGSGSDSEADSASEATRPAR